MSAAWKMHIARMVRWPLVNQLMSLAIVLTVPRRRLGVNLVPLSADGRVLLLHHVFHPHMPWGLPGGWLGRNEAPTDCALRELKEETGLTAVLGPLLLIEPGVRPRHLGVVYLGYVQPGPLTLSYEISAAEWFDPDALPPLLPFARRAIETAVAQSAAPHASAPHARPTIPAEDVYR